MMATSSQSAMAAPASAGPESSAVDFSHPVVKTLSSLSGWQVIITAFCLLVVYDQVKYVYRKGGIAGPSWKIPFMGPFLQSVNPEFEGYLAKWASGPLSCVSIFHKFVVISSNRDLTRKILTSPAFVKPCLVDIAEKILRPSNWVFLDGKAHSEYRKGLNGLFSPKALETYLPGQEDVYDEYFDKFCETSRSSNYQPVPFMSAFREINCAISCRTFVGKHLSEESVDLISSEYYKITSALELVNFPIIIPFTKAWYGKKAADMVLAMFEECAAKSRKHIAGGGEVTCIVDGWIKQILVSEQYRTKVANGVDVPSEEKPTMILRQFSDTEISQTLFTFLFASQDASSSSTTWLFQVLADRPDVMERVREEQLRVRDGDRNRRIDMQMLQQMTYTRAVVKEILRYRPPVIVVPYAAKENFPISENYTVPKGSMIVPSFYPALHDPEAYPNPGEFDPDRWITGNADKAVKNWLVFGTGAHMCIGRDYLLLNMMGLIGKASLFLDWEHEVTPLSEKIKVFATIFPMDDCRLVFKRRE
ncbi:sterol C-22 desaturase [Xylona heveae TC161]|uniref:sterol 22-desaturase n=1 Tax=Xylona heveae (strain CBS 132557 / TC161) TaxID=1328760 RepID=A0A165JYA0_XYLHT|nr:sterol C-22 desaturase [Xylona heveae TC161]KZF26777.1 sterol C-22 desaturase [Xylona heveae TC161]